MAHTVETESGDPGPRFFNTTHWSVVLQAGMSDSPRTDAALAELCNTYRDPLLTFLRSMRVPPLEAEDLVQEFFAALVAHRQRKLQTLDPKKGKFRSFLLASLKHFIADQWDKGNALKRGGGADLVFIDAPAGDNGPGIEPVDRASPDRAYDRRWAITVTGRAAEALKQEMAEKGKAHIFEALADFLLEKAPGPSHEDIARRLGVSPNNIRNAVQKLRARYGELIRDEIANTLANPTKTAVDEELKCLLDALE